MNTNSNKELLRRLYAGINARDPATIAECYAENATFRDIAFDLNGRSQILAMWKMICLPDNGKESNIEVSVNDLSASEKLGHAHALFKYTFRETDRDVENLVESKFTFDNNFIVNQSDDCNAIAWAKQAFGGLKGYIVGHFEFIRRMGAMKKLRQKYSEAFKH